MFTIISQQKKLFLSMMEAELQSSGESQKVEYRELTSTSADDIFNGFRDFYRVELQKMQKKTLEQLSDAEKKSLKNAKEFIQHQTDYLNSVRISTDITKSQLNDLKELNSLAQKIGENKAEVVTQASQQQKETLYKTLEENDSSLVIEAGTGEKDFTKLRENINYTSYEDMITKMSFDELGSFYNELKSLADKHNKTESGKHYYTPTNISELKEAFRKAGYTADGFFGGIEMGSLMMLVKNVYQTQEKLKQSTDFKEKVAVIFDYSQDGLLDNNVQFYTKELQFFDAVENEEQFENLLKNLGYADKGEFFKKFHDNYFAARQDFKMRLGTVLHTAEVINPGEMLRNPKAVYEFNQYKYNKQLDQSGLGVDKEIWKEVNQIIQEHEVIGTLPAETQKGIELQAVSALVGSGYGVGASFDIKNATNAILDNLYVLNVQGTFGVGVSKKIVQTEGGFSVDVGAVNFIPFISASGPISKAEYDEFKKLFPKEIDSTTEISLAGTLTSKGIALTVDFAEFDTETQAGIELAKTRMSKDFDTLTKDIVAGKVFTESSLNDTPSAKSYYEALSGLYKSNKEDKHLFAYIKEGALNNYERELYQRASEGVNYAGFSLGVLLLKGYLPIPLVMVRGEDHDTTWKEVETYEQKKVEQKVVTKTEKKEYLKTKMFEGHGDLIKQVSEFQSSFNANTRWNKGAKDFIEPTNSLEKRWKGLEQLAKSTGKLRNAKLPQFLSKITDETQKWVVISTLAQYIKTANDFGNGSVDLWNKETKKGDKNKDKFIKTDKERRKAFDNVFGFSLNEEANKYYEALTKSQGNISEIKEQGLGFDVTSTINVERTNKIKGVDAIYTDLSILAVDGEPIFIPITDTKKIEAFKKTVEKSTILDSVKQELITAINSGDIELNYYKDPLGFNDRILPRIKKEVTTTTSTTVKNNNTPVIDVFQPSFQTTTVGLAAIGEQRKNDKGESSFPGKDDTKDPDAPDIPGEE